MDPSDDKLMEEALEIIDTIDFEALSTAIAPSATNIADDLLDEAIRAVQAAFPNSNLEGRRQSAARMQHQDQQNTSADALRVLIDAAENVEKPSPGSKGRVRVREQLIRLREVVKKMETHLEALASPHSSRLEALEAEEGKSIVADENDSAAANFFSDESNEAALWRNIAIQQFRARRKAEHENAELRGNLSKQMHLAKQVETLLRLQQQHHEELEDPPPSHQDEEKTN